VHVSAFNDVGSKLVLLPIFLDDYFLLLGEIGAFLTAASPATLDLDQHQNMLVENASTFIVSITLMTGHGKAVIFVDDDHNALI